MRSRRLKRADTLLSADVEACRLTGRILWNDSTPPQLQAEPAYVLIHGIGVSHRYLARLHDLLAATAPTYSLDLPGFGGTPKPGRQLSVEEYGIVFTDYVRCGLGWYLTELPMMMAYPTEKRLAFVDTPTLILRGSRDPVAGRVVAQVVPLGTAGAAGRDPKVRPCGPAPAPKGRG
jgi:alpha-beta hydrolase superfamily lysophospholipase